MAWIDANGVSLRYVMSGGGAPTVVLLHEMGGCLESWDPVVAALQPHARLLAYDARGAGLSEKPTGDFSLADLSGDLAALLDGLGLGPVLLVGCAVGAAVAMHFAASHPQRVSGLIALAPALGIAPERRADALALAETLQHDGMRARTLARFDTSYPLRFFEGRSDRADIRARLLQNDSRAYAHTYRMLCGMDIAPELSRIRAPTLLVAGEADRTRPPALVEAIAEAIPNAAFQVIDSGHVMHLLTPMLIAEMIKRMLEKLPE